MRLTTHTLRSGTGTPVVLLHAFPLDARMWAEMAALLPAGTPVIAVDLPGMGASPLPDTLAPASTPSSDITPSSDTAPSLDTAADAVAALWTEGGPLDRPAVVAGLSMGGYVALALAERHPELIAALALLDTKAVADTSEAAAHRRRIADEAEHTDSVDPVRPMVNTLLGESTRATRPDLVAQVADWIEDQRPAGIAWSQRAMAARADRTLVLRSWNRPSLVLVGAEDGPTPPEQATAMAAELGTEPVIVPAAGHLTALESPLIVAEALSALLARL
ncbi:alpha/beta hydrolase [Cellulomonas sp. NPDC089187]|uniref:alpha/beta fold hydrolase n=1 Tax=Cellulomonas sp. NPDC089187 TaxID=3154970 RepID=UPI00342F5FD9